MRAAKFDIMRSEIKYLEGIKPDPEAVAKVDTWMAPRSKQNYYREFVPFSAEKAEPLNALLRKNLGFSWNERAEKAFQEVKHALMSATALAAPNDTGTF